MNMVRQRRSRVDVLYPPPSSRRSPRQDHHPRGIVKPRRPMTGYNMFVKQFVTKKGHKYARMRDAFLTAASRWSHMSSNQRLKYSRLGNRGRAQYEQAMRRYREQVKAQRGPKRPFVEYFSRFYNTLTPTQLEELSVPQIAQLAAAQWHDLPASVKGQYSDYFKQQYEVYLRGQPICTEVLPLIELPQAVAIASAAVPDSSGRANPAITLPENYDVIATAGRRRRRQSRASARSNDDRETVICSGSDNGDSTSANAGTPVDARSGVSANETPRAENEPANEPALARRRRPTMSRRRPTKRRASMARRQRRNAKSRSRK